MITILVLGVMIIVTALYAIRVGLRQERQTYRVLKQENARWEATHAHLRLGRQTWSH